MYLQFHGDLSKPDVGPITLMTFDTRIQAQLLTIPYFSIFIDNMLPGVRLIILMTIAKRIWIQADYKHSFPDQKKNNVLFIHKVQCTPTQVGQT